MPVTPSLEAYEKTLPIPKRHYIICLGPQLSMLNNLQSISSTKNQFLHIYVMLLAQLWALAELARSCQGRTLKLELIFPGKKLLTEKCALNCINEHSGPERSSPEAGENGSNCKVIFVCFKIGYFLNSLLFPSFSISQIGGGGTYEGRLWAQKELARANCK